MARNRQFKLGARTCPRMRAPFLHIPQIPNIAYHRNLLDYPASAEFWGVLESVAARDVRGNRMPGSGRVGGV
jgi:hypothetical protein